MADKLVNKKEESETSIHFEVFVLTDSESEFIGSSGMMLLSLKVGGNKQRAPVAVFALSRTDDDQDVCLALNDFYHMELRNLSLLDGTVLRVSRALVQQGTDRIVLTCTVDQSAFDELSKWRAGQPVMAIVWSIERAKGLVN